MLNRGLSAFVYSRFAFPAFRRVNNVRPLVIYYHLVSDDHVPHIDNLYRFRNIGQFRSDLDVLCKFYRPLAISDYLAGLTTGEDFAGRFILTFDDGLRQCHDVVAPILREKGIPGTFFVCSAFTDNKQLAYDHKKSLLVELVKSGQLSPARAAEAAALLLVSGLAAPSLERQLLLIDYPRRNLLDQLAALFDYDFSQYLEKVRPYLTSEQLRGLIAEGHGVGAHSIDHPRYRDLPLDEQLYQTTASIRFVKDAVKISYGAFSFPHSDVGISAEFFRQIFSTGDVDICFGNQGFADDVEPRNIQRCSMESGSMSAGAAIGRAWLRRMVKIATADGLVQRPERCSSLT